MCHVYVKLTILSRKEHLFLGPKKVCKICDGPVDVSDQKPRQPMCLECKRSFSSNSHLDQHQKAKRHSNASVVQNMLWSGQTTASSVCPLCLQSCGISTVQPATTVAQLEVSMLQWVQTESGPCMKSTKIYQS